MKLLSVNVGRLTSVDYADTGTTGIDKRPAEGAVRVSDPGRKGEGGSGVAGDAISDLRHHGGTDQAVYAFAREDLDRWEEELGMPLASGSFGENLTTSGLDVNGALIGERWRIGEELVLEVTSGRIPCRTFARWLDRMGVPPAKRGGGWVRRFTREAAPGAYLRVITPGEIRAGDPIEIVHRPEHEVTVSMSFRAETTERSLLPRVLAAGDALHPEQLRAAREYVAKYGTGAAELPIVS
ncbi:MOSC domain-containing protein [Streptomyces sp. NPDC015127]|uniref:MOSC domain-containing protein n=1 Tax=Streptomyces sp. NPDC015127 TaxID=3364939 RepID=UPI0036F4F482